MKIWPILITQLISIAKKKLQLLAIEKLQDKFKGNISDATYKRLSQETESLLNKAQLDLENYKNTKKECIKTKELEEYEKRIRELIDIKRPTRELLQTLIDKIEIDKDKNIEIFYRFII